MPVLKLRDYLDTHGGGPAGLARKIGLSRQRIEYYLNHSTLDVHVDYEIKTGVINKVTATKENVLYSKGEGNEQID